jgi:hypothetical protein
MISDGDTRRLLSSVTAAITCDVKDVRAFVDPALRWAKIKCFSSSIEIQP